MTIGIGHTTPANWLETPHTRWSLHHVEELIPTAVVSKGDRAPRQFDAEPHELSAQALDFCAATHTDAIIVLRGGTVLHEQYFGEMTADSRHLVMSVSKSFCGMLAGVLVEEGVLDLKETTATYVPELSGDPYGTATVAELLDMTASVHYDMTHTDIESEVDLEDRSTGWRPRRPGDPANSREYLQRLRPGGPEHGETFQYSSATTEVLGWVLERAAGVPYAQLMSERLWSRMGAEADAYVTVDSAGVPYACAGFGMRLRDLARFGRLLLDGGIQDGEKVIPADWISRTFADADHEIMGDHQFAEIHAKGGYRNQWWITGDDHGSVCAAGLLGQYLWLDPATDVIVAKFSCIPLEEDMRPWHSKQLRAIAEEAAAWTL